MILNNLDLFTDKLLTSQFLSNSGKAQFYTESVISNKFLIVFLFVVHFEKVVKPEKLPEKLTTWLLQFPTLVAANRFVTNCSKLVSVLLEKTFYMLRQTEVTGLRPQYK